MKDHFKCLQNKEKRKRTKEEAEGGRGTIDGDPRDCHSRAD